MQEGGLMGTSALVIEKGQVEGCGCKSEAGEKGGGKAHR